MIYYGRENGRGHRGVELFLCAHVASERTREIVRPQPFRKSDLRGERGAPFASRVGKCNLPLSVSRLPKEGARLQKHINTYVFKKYPDFPPSRAESIAANALKNH